MSVNFICGWFMLFPILFFCKLECLNILISYIPILMLITVFICMTNFPTRITARVVFVTKFFISQNITPHIFIISTKLLKCIV